MRLLVVEDEIRLADAIAPGPRRRGMDVEVAHDGDDGCDRSRSLGYDVLILDRDLPGRSGDEICQSLTATGGSGPLLMPFQVAELAHRIQAFGELSALI